MSIVQIYKHTLFRKVGIMLLVFLVLFSSFAGGPPMNTPVEGNLYSARNEKADKYEGLRGILERYYDEQVRVYGKLANYHEENYISQNGQHSISSYNGMLCKVIKDLDNDMTPEMITFRMETKLLDEFSNKEIIMEIIKLVNGMTTVSDSCVISSEQYNGEEIDCHIGMKYVGDEWRVYLNYYSKKVLEGNYESKFIATTCANNINVLSTINMSGNVDDYENSSEFQDEIVDAGVNIQDDNDIYKKAFIFDDMGMLPIFTIKRVNEKVKEGFFEDYLEQHPEKVNDEGFVKIRYGYTNFIDRTDN